MSDYSGAISFALAAIVVFLGGLLFGVWHLGGRNWTKDALRATKVLGRMEEGDERALWERELLASLTRISAKTREAQRARRDGRWVLVTALAIVLVSFIGVLWINTQLAARSFVPAQAAPVAIPDPYVDIEVIHCAAAITVCLLLLLVRRARRRQR